MKRFPSPMIRRALAIIGGLTLLSGWAPPPAATSADDCAILEATLDAIEANEPESEIETRLASVSISWAPGSSRDPGAEVRTLNLRACPNLGPALARGHWTLFDPTAAERNRLGPKGFEHLSRLWRKGDAARLRYHSGLRDEAPGEIDLRRRDGAWKVERYVASGIWVSGG